MAFSQAQNIPNDYQQLDVLLAQMAALVETNLGDAITAFARNDINMARSLIEADRRVDSLHNNLEMGVYQLLEKSLLPSHEVRGALAMVKIASDIERVGDLAKNIGRRIPIIARDKITSHHAGVVRMGVISLRQLSDILTAYTSRDLVAAQAVWAGDDEVDELYKSVFREILVAMQEDPSRVNSATHMVFVAKNFERVGDHATNIAESLHFMMTGHPFKTGRNDTPQAINPVTNFPIPDNQ